MIAFDPTASAHAFPPHGPLAVVIVYVAFALLSVGVSCTLACSYATDAVYDVVVLTTVGDGVPADSASAVR